MSLVDLQTIYSAMLFQLFWSTKYPLIGSTVKEQRRRQLPDVTWWISYADLVVHWTKQYHHPEGVALQCHHTWAPLHIVFYHQILGTYHNTRQQVKLHQSNHWVQFHIAPIYQYTGMMDPNSNSQRRIERETLHQQRFLSNLANCKILIQLPYDTSMHAAQEETGHHKGFILGKTRQNWDPKINRTYSLFPSG